MIKTLSIFLLGICLNTTIQAQPYIDIISVRAVSSPDVGIINRNKRPVVLNYAAVNTAFPIKFGNKGDAFIISPFGEKWTVKSPDQNDSSHSYYGLVLPVSLRKALKNDKWSLQTTFILRVNSESIGIDEALQAGGFLLFNYKAKETITYRFGIYLNDEIFGLFVLPLAGIDWKINKRANLFGVLPNNLTLEYKLNKTFYTGATIRTFTNSYADAKTSYWRVNERQIGGFLDTYLSKNIVLNVEAGHSILRKLRSGIYENQEPYNWNVNDNLYVKLMLAYRVRFR